MPVRIVRRALARTKRASLRPKTGALIWALQKSGLPPRTRDDFFQATLRHVYEHAPGRFPAVWARRAINFLDERSSGAGESAEDLIRASSMLPNRRSEKFYVEHRSARKSYKNKVFQASLADAIFARSGAYESVVLTAVVNVPGSIGHLTGKLRNLLYRP
jgi:hypothetical protein